MGYAKTKIIVFFQEDSTGDTFWGTDMLPVHLATAGGSDLLVTANFWTSLFHQNW